MVYGWVRGKHACVDLTGVSPLVGLGVGDFTVGRAAIKVVSSKMVKHDKACFDNQYVFISFAFNIIYHCISSSVMQVIFNGRNTVEFSPTQGICQGDPLSLYLFVLAIERFAHLIQMKVDDKTWKPI
jgi:hypothetical protein